jgi:hypothetical protein
MVKERRASTRQKVEAGKQKARKLSGTGFATHRAFGGVNSGQVTAFALHQAASRAALLLASQYIVTESLEEPKEDGGSTFFCVHCSRAFC